MADDIKTMTTELARDPDSLAFLRLGEVLRAQGRLDAAAKVAIAGIERHPDLADARDLYARVLADAGSLEQAHEQWAAALRFDPKHLGALKGLGYLLYRYGDLDSALDHLETALSVDPTDQTVIQALRTVREAAGQTAFESQPRLPEAIFAGFEGASEGILLFDSRGRVLGGALRDANGEDAAEAVAAYLAGASQEAERTGRLLGLGDWRTVVAEAPAGNLHVSQLTHESMLLVKRDRSVPPGRLALIAQRAAAAARTWLEMERA